jgi:hypothetical protein
MHDRSEYFSGVELPTTLLIFLPNPPRTRVKLLIHNLRPFLIKCLWDREL